MRLEGAKEMLEALERARAEIRAEAEIIIAETLEDVHRRMVYKLHREPKSGHWVFSYNSRKMHQQSAPGEAPASDSGTLAGSLFIEQFGLTGYVGANAEYAETLEFSKNRPFLNPSLEEEAPEFFRRLSGLLE